MSAENWTKSQVFDQRSAFFLYNLRVDSFFYPPLRQPILVVRRCTAQYAFGAFCIRFCALFCDTLMYLEHLLRKGTKLETRPEIQWVRITIMHTTFILSTLVFDLNVLGRPCWTRISEYVI